jgi:hypothetical protein
MPTMDRKVNLKTGWDVPDLRHYFSDSKDATDAEDFSVVVPNPREIDESKNISLVQMELFNVIDHSKFQVFQTAGDRQPPIPIKIEESTALVGDIRDFFCVIPADSRPWQFRTFVWIQDDLVFAKDDFDKLKAKKRVWHVCEENNTAGWICTLNSTTKKGKGRGHSSTQGFKFLSDSAVSTQRHINDSGDEDGEYSLPIQMSTRGVARSGRVGGQGAAQFNATGSDECESLLHQRRPLWLRANPSF